MRELGWTVEDGTYHNNFSPAARKILQNMNYNRTGLYFKGWPDNYVLKEDYAILWEWKTQEYQRQPMAGKNIPNGSIEATQYAFHWTLASIGIKVVYAYWDPFYDIEKGFVLDKTNPFEVVSNIVRFPTTADLEPFVKEEQTGFLNDAFGDYLRIHPEPKGSNISSDPYFLIFADTLEKLPHWRKLLP